jgi:flagellar protein FliO/FliZ
MSFVDIIRAFGALLFTLALLGGIALLVRKYGLMGGQSLIPNQKRRLKINEQLWLDAGRTRILIIECDGNESVIMVGANGAHKIEITTKPTQI